jgi:hypothetical protein
MIGSDVLCPGFSRIGGQRCAESPITDRKATRLAEKLSKGTRDSVRHRYACSVGRDRLLVLHEGASSRVERTRVSPREAKNPVRSRS